LWKLYLFFVIFFLKSLFIILCVILDYRLFKQKRNGAYAHDVMAAILVFQNNETAAKMVYQANPVEVQLFSYVQHFLLFQ